MPGTLGWIFGSGSDEASRHPPEDHLDPELKLHRTTSSESEIKGGTFPSINARPPPPDSSSIIADAVAVKTQSASPAAWKVFGRSDSTEELSEGVFPSVSDLSPASPTSKKSSLPKSSRPGLPPPAPKSPPMFAFSRKSNSGSSISRKSSSSGSGMASDSSATAVAAGVAVSGKKYARTIQASGESSSAASRPAPAPPGIPKQQSGDGSDSSSLGGSSYANNSTLVGLRSQQEGGARRGSKKKTEGRGRGRSGGGGGSGGTGHGRRSSSGSSSGGGGFGSSQDEGPHPSTQLSFYAKQKQLQEQQGDRVTPPPPPPPRPAGARATPLTTTTSASSAAPPAEFKRGPPSSTKPGVAMDQKVARQATATSDAVRRIEAAIAAGAAGGGTGDRKASSPASASFAPYNTSRGRPPSRPPLNAAQAQAHPHQAQAQAQPQAGQAQPEAQAPAQAQAQAQVPAPMPPLVRNDGASGGHPGGSGPAPVGAAAAGRRGEDLVSRSESLGEDILYEGRTASRKSSFTSAGRSMVSGGQRGFMGCFRRMGSLTSSATTRGASDPAAAAAAPPGNVSASGMPPPREPSAPPSFRLPGVSKGSTPSTSPRRFRSKPSFKTKRRSSAPPPGEQRAPRSRQSDVSRGMAAGIENGGVGAKGLRAVAGGGSVREGGVGGEDGREWQEGGGGRAPEEEKGDEADGGKDGEGGEKEEEEEPEAVVSATVSMKGLLECGRSMRMDGKFVGDLVSSGSITVGPTGTVTGDLKGLKFLRVEGQVIGDVVCDRVMVLHEGKVYGDITAVSITVGPQATMRGMMNVVADMDEARAEPKKALDNNAAPKKSHKGQGSVSRVGVHPASTAAAGAAPAMLKRTRPQTALPPAGQHKAIGHSGLGEKQTADAAAGAGAAAANTNGSSAAVSVSHPVPSPGSAVPSSAVGVSGASGGVAPAPEIAAATAAATAASAAADAVAAAAAAAGAAATVSEAQAVVAPASGTVPETGAPSKELGKDEPARILSASGSVEPCAVGAPHS